MESSSEVAVPVEPEAAATDADARNRAAVGRLVSRVLRPRSGLSPLAYAIADLKAYARTTGLTDVLLSEPCGRPDGVRLSSVPRFC